MLPDRIARAKTHFLNPQHKKILIAYAPASQPRVHDLEQLHKAGVSVPRPHPLRPQIKIPTEMAIEMGRERRQNVMLVRGLDTRKVP